MRDRDRMRETQERFFESLDKFTLRAIDDENALISCIDAMELQFWGIKP